MIRLWIATCLGCLFLLSGCKLSVELGTEFQKNTIIRVNENTSFFQEPTTKLCFMSSYIVDSYMVTNVPCEAAIKSSKFVKVEQK